jgi:hypothetical protein
MSSGEYRAAVLSRCKPSSRTCHAIRSIHSWSSAGPAFAYMYGTRQNRAPAMDVSEDRQPAVRSRGILTYTKHGQRAGSTY